MTSRVLIVDDSLTVRMDLVEVFSGAGFDASAASSLAEARRLLEAERFDLLLLDVLLPDGDGPELISELRRRPALAELPILLLSAEGEVRVRVRGLQAGATDYIAKPYDPAFLIARARELVRPTAVGGRCTQILVIDDSATFLEHLREGLVAAGYEVIAASTGEQGLRLASDFRPAAMIVDGMLPGIDGATVIRRIRLDGALRSIPCLLLTASDSRADEVLALESGADAFARKDLELEVILARLGALLRAAPAPMPVAPAPSLQGPKRILAVDDSETYLQVIAGVLRDDGYDVVAARSGEEALELLAVQEVDCVVLDLMMPGLGGQETCRRVRERPKSRDLPVVMLTALDDRDAMISCINSGADDYIPKSGDFTVLLARLRAQLRRKQFESEHRRMREELLLADARASMLADLERKNEALAATNDALDQARELAQQESQFKSRFLAGMSHELRTPLNAIIGFSEMLERELYGSLNPKQKKSVGYVVTSGRHLLALINDILDLAKIEAGRADVQREWVALATLIDTVQGVVAPLVSQQGVQLEVEVHDPDGQPIHVDPTRIKQVLYNLLSNAIKFTPRGGQVRLMASTSEDHVEIAVSDTGVGISAENMPRLFREFERLETGANRPEGTGLGLVLTRRFVDLHGGTIGVKSERGQGTTFTVRLPRSLPAAVAEER
jgi:DNA-binding response OmpR family regulator/anti-sigma regulatory factor (Ser/Thr protein kinase)